MRDRAMTVACLCALAWLAAAFPRPAAACGFHSSFLAKKITPREWWEYHKHEYVEEKEEAPVISGGGSQEPAVFRKKPSETAPEVRTRQKALIAMMLKHLLYLTSTNVMPAEFPDFKTSSIPDYNKSFRDILVELGADAVPFILEAYLNTLYVQNEDGLGLERNAQFKDDLVDVLVRIGRRSVAAIAAVAATQSNKRSQEALVSLIGKVLEREATLQGVPALVQGALERWAEGGARLRAMATDDRVPGPERGLILNVWLGIAFARGEVPSIIAYLRDRTEPEHLRSEAVEFLAARGHGPAVAEFLARAEDSEEGVFVRRSCLRGIWEIHLQSETVPMDAVRASTGLKKLVTGSEEPKALRIHALYLLAHLADASLLDAVLLLLHREEEDEGVRVAALEAVEILDLQARAAARLDPRLLLKRRHVAEYRFRLLALLGYGGDKKIAEPLVRIVLAEDEFVPMRLKALLALHRLNFPGYERAETIVLEKTELVDAVAAFIFDANRSGAERAGVIRDLEVLLSLQARALTVALVRSGKAEAAIRTASLPVEIRVKALALFLRWKGAEAVGLVREILEDPEAPPELLAAAASWAGTWRVDALADALRALRTKGRDPAARLAALEALFLLGEKTEASAVAQILFPRSGPAPDSGVVLAALGLLGRLGTREALAAILRCVKPAHGGPWDVTAAALAALGRTREGGRAAFSQVWHAFRAGELGNIEARTAFLECFLLLGPSQEICDFLVKQGQLELTRIPLGVPAFPGRGVELPEEDRQILPALHALALLNAYMTKKPDLFDLSQGQQIFSTIQNWYFAAKRTMPRE